jgi:hypothetical protein
VSGVSGGGWKGLADRYDGWKTVFMSGVVEVETRLEKECEREDAVDWSWDWSVLPSLVARGPPFDAGLESVLSRRRMPDIAYETGYVKYEDERVGVER